MKLKQKEVPTSVIAVIVIVVVAVAAAGAYLLTRGPEGAAPGEGEEEVEGEGLTLSSVDFTFSGNSVRGWTGAIRCRARNLRSDAPDFRIEETTGELRKFIINNTAGEYYDYGCQTSGVWTRYTGSLAETYFKTICLAFESMATTVNALIVTHGTTADFTDTYEGVTVSITNITANPTLEDELFSPPPDATVEEYIPVYP